MKMLSAFIKTFRENLRDWKILSLAVLFAPFFIYIMKGYMSGTGAEKMNILVHNSDRGGVHSEGLLEAWKKASELNIIETADTQAAAKKISDRSADLLAVIPAGFSRGLESYLAGKGAVVQVVGTGDPANARFNMAAAFTDYVTYSYLGSVSKNPMPVMTRFEDAGVPGRKQDMFTAFVPAMMVFSLIMLLFTAGATLVREVEKGTITRIALSKLSPAGFLAGITVNQLIIGGLCMAFTYAAALSVGYDSTGSFALLALTGTLTAFSIVAMAVIMVCFIRTMFGLLTVGCFPFFILMFFSDCFMPLPKYKIAELFGNALFLNDILPTAVGVRAMNKIMNFNADLADVGFELTLITVLGAAYFTLGAFMFNNAYLKKR